ncbi:unnamed protein product [Calypogeia fissa]
MPLPSLVKSPRLFLIVRFLNFDGYDSPSKSAWRRPAAYPVIQIPARVLDGRRHHAFPRLRPPDRSTRGASIEIRRPGAGCSNLAQLASCSSVVNSGVTQGRTRG